MMSLKHLGHFRLLIKHFVALKPHQFRLCPLVFCLLAPEYYIDVLFILAGGFCFYL